MNASKMKADKMKARQFGNFVIVGVAAMAAMALVTAGRASAQSLAKIKATLQSLYAAADKAEGERDFTGAMAIYTPDFIGYSIKGKAYSPDETKQGMEDAVLRTNTFTRKTVIQSVAVVTGGVTVTAHSWDTMQGRSDITNTEVTVVVNHGYRDFWIKTADGWKIKQEKRLTISATRDGVPVSGSPH